MKALGITILLTSLLISTPASAQNANVDKRVERLEQELRAIQRKVFPGGSSRYFEPEITGESGPAPSTATVTTSAVTDLMARVDALEASLATLTGQVEENGFRLKKIEDRLAAMEPSAASPNTETGVGQTPAAAPKAAPDAAPDPKRVAAVAAIVMPETGDAAEDAIFTATGCGKPISIRKHSRNSRKWWKIILAFREPALPRICWVAPISMMASPLWPRSPCMRIIKKGRGGTAHRTAFIF